jgi:hypothetical protein
MGQRRGVSFGSRDALDNITHCLQERVALNLL